MDAALKDLLLEQWLRQREQDEIIWTTKNNDKLSIRKMSDSHLANAISCLLKNYDENTDI